jgi:hypothetical protein
MDPSSPANVTPINYDFTQYVVKLPPYPPPHHHESPITVHKCMGSGVLRRRSLGEDYFMTGVYLPLAPWTTKVDRGVGLAVCQHLGIVAISSSEAETVSVFNTYHPRLLTLAQNATVIRAIQKWSHPPPLEGGLG